MIGDIFELDTDAGKAYLHFIGQSAEKTDYVRILQGLHQDTPEDFDSLALKPEQFIIEFVIGPAIRLGVIRKVGHSSAANHPVPKYFRRKSLGRLKGWDIVEAETRKMRFVEHLSPEERKLSPSSFWNDTLLKERLVAGWKLEDWV